MLDAFHVRGLQRDSRNRYIHISHADSHITLPQSAFAMGNTKLADLLAQAGMPIFDKEQRDTLTAEVKAIAHFEDALICERAGWNGDAYAMPDGSVFSPSSQRAYVAFPVDASRYQAKGDLVTWKEQVAKVALRNPMTTLIFAAMFLPPLQRFMPHVDNVIIELIGKPGTGKSTLQRAAISAFGDPGHGYGGQGIRLDDLLGGVEQVVNAHGHYPMIIDGVSSTLMTANKAKTQAIYKALAHDLAQSSRPIVAVISGRERLKAACGVPTGDDSMITSMIPDDSTSGIFATLPAGYPHAVALAEHLASASAANHGHAYQHFMAQLMKRLQHNPDKVKAKLDALQEQFLRDVQLDGSDGRQQAIARAFAAIYAAGRYATLLKALPNGSCRKMVLEAYSLHQAANAPEPPFAQRLRNLIEDETFLRIEKGADQSEQIEAALAAIGTVKVTRTRLFVRIPPDNITQAFPDWALLEKRAEVRALLKMDGRNLKAHCSLAPGMESKRMFQFSLPLKADALDVKPEGTLFDGVEEDDW